jgi:hypothetical protein
VFSLTTILLPLQGSMSALACYQPAKGAAVGSSTFVDASRALTQPGSTVCLSGTNWRWRHDDLNKPCRDVINEAGNKPLGRQCRNRPERSNIDNHGRRCKISVKTEAH